MLEKSTMLQDAPSSSREETGVLDLIQDLCDLLEIESINYCHWKSNAMLDRSAIGDNDLDLLISHSDATRFTSILFDLGFIQAVSPADEQIPGILDYYGLDQSSGKLVHVHAHYCLVLGHDATKNYHLPLEQAYLNSSFQNGLFRIPAIEFEFVIFAIRMTLKHATWEAILSGQGYLSPSERQELAYMKERYAEENVNRILAQFIPEVNPGLFYECVRAIEQTPPLLERIRTGSRLQNCLKAYAIRPKLVDTWLILSSRPKHILQAHLLRKHNKKRIAYGGVLIAIAGGDGAGKTTAIQEIRSWLSEVFDVATVHMGKPKWSLTTILVRGILKIGNLLHLYPFMRAEIKYTYTKEDLKFPGYPWCLREICTARDRFLTYKKAVKFSQTGGVVLCDRYPLYSIRFMDAPQIEWLASDAKPSWLVMCLSQIEKRFYQKIDFPDLLIILRTDPMIAVQRKKDEAPESVYARSAEIWNMEWDNVSTHVVDANLSKNEVHSEMKRVIWSYF